nr:hypothetical protein [Lactococcus ileimucosae]
MMNPTKFDTQKRSYSRTSVFVMRGSHPINLALIFMVKPTSKDSNDTA